MKGEDASAEEAPALDWDEMPKEVADIFRMTALAAALGIPAFKLGADMRLGLEDLRRDGVITLQYMADLHAKVVEEAKGDPALWTSGFVIGYRAAWSAAIQRVLDTREVDVDKNAQRLIQLWPDSDALALLLENAVTATDEFELFARVPKPFASSRS